MSPVTWAIFKLAVFKWDWVRSEEKCLVRTATAVSVSEAIRFPIGPTLLQHHTTRFPRYSKHRVVLSNIGLILIYLYDGKYADSRGESPWSSALLCWISLSPFQHDLFVQEITEEEQEAVLGNECTLQAIAGKTMFHSQRCWPSTSIPSFILQILLRLAGHSVL